jgi:hypothetical protein
MHGPDLYTAIAVSIMFFTGIVALIVTLAHHNTTRMKHGGGERRHTHRTFPKAGEARVA